jgi:hypothetical protein
MRTYFFSTVGCLLLLLLLATASAAESFSARLVPRPGTGATGSGTGSFTLDNQGVDLTFTIEYSGLTGPEVASHIHRPDGSIAFTLPPGDEKMGVWTNIGTIDRLLLRSEQLYVLVHTDQNPSGELRGDILMGPLSGRLPSWSRLKSSYELER